MATEDSEKTLTDGLSSDFDYLKEFWKWADIHYPEGLPRDDPYKLAEIESFFRQGAKAEQISAEGYILQDYEKPLKIPTEAEIERVKELGRVLLGLESVSEVAIFFRGEETKE